MLRTMPSLCHIHSNEQYSRFVPMNSIQEIHWLCFNFGNLFVCETSLHHFTSTAEIWTISSPIHPSVSWCLVILLHSVPLQARQVHSCGEDSHLAVVCHPKAKVTDLIIFYNLQDRNKQQELNTENFSEKKKKKENLWCQNKHLVIFPA